MMRRLPDRSPPSRRKSGFDSRRIVGDFNLGPSKAERLLKLPGRPQANEGSIPSGSTVIKEMEDLRRFIELVLEDIRSAPGFNIDVMKKFKTVPEIYNYVKQFLKPMGRGSSRMTYLLSSRKILKIAKNDAGLSQNEAEVDVFTNPSTKDVVARIFDYDPQNKWLVSELVKPLSWDQFEHITRWGWQEFVDCLKSKLQGGGFQEKDVPQHMRKWFNAVVEMAQANKLSLGDLKVDNHWGKTADNRVVLLDYGLTYDVGDKHYVGRYPANYAGVSKTNHNQENTDDVDWADAFDDTFKI